MKRFLSLGLFAAFAGCFAAAVAFAADPVPASIDLATFAGQVLEAIKALGGLPWVAKIASITMLIIGSMKVDLIRGLLWDKLPEGVKPFLAPALGMLAGILSLDPITFKGVVAYVSAGAGAIILYELLDAIKVAAAANATVSGVIGFVQSVLKRN